MAGFIPNLHITTEGDAAVALTWVPYGKQLIVDMMLGGVTYMTRKHHVSDLVEVTAKIAGEQRYLHIKAGGCTIHMDSGVVNLRSVASTHPDRLKAGFIHYSDALAALVAESRLVGTLRSQTTFESKAPAEGGECQSFTPSPQDANILYLKKLAVANCPASIFTGKMRLYIQALYGAKLSAFSNFSLVIHGLSAPPYLQYSKDGQQIALNTNTGLYTTADYEYFLVTVASDSITVRELELSSCGKTLAAKLKAGEVAAADIDRVEAYALSTGRPSTRVAFTMEVAGLSAVHGWMLGYGWHFNWDGNLADIVNTQTGITNPQGGYQYSSTHYRLTLTRDSTFPDQPGLDPGINESLRWGATVAVREGPVTWKIPKWGDVIAYPEWSQPVLWIFGDLLGTNLNTSAPFYCFYKRNELQLVRAQRTGGESGSWYEVYSDPPFYYGGIRPLTQNNPMFQICAADTAGSDAAWSEHRTFTGKPIRVTLSCNGAGPTDESSYVLYAFRRSSEKTIGPPFPYVWHWDGYYSDTQQVRAGPPDPGLSESSILGCLLNPSRCIGSFYVSVPGPGHHGQAFTPIAWTISTGSGTRTKAGKTLCVIPYYDAEAVYLWGQDYDQFNESGSTYGWSYNGIYGGHVEHNMYTTHPGIYIRTDRIYDEPVSSPTAGPDFNTGNVAVYTESYAKVHSSAGTFAFTPTTSLGAFFAGESGGGVVSQLWPTKSSVGGSIVGEGVDLTGGYDTAALAGKPYTFVGHA